MGTAGITQGPRIIGIFRALALSAAVKAAAVKILAAAGVGTVAVESRGDGGTASGGPQPTPGGGRPPPMALQPPELLGEQ